jgi:hypothetical protein
MDLSDMSGDLRLDGDHLTRRVSYVIQQNRDRLNLAVGEPPPRLICGCSGPRVGRIGITGFYT